MKKAFLGFLLWMGFLPIAALMASESLQLASEGKTNYTIVLPNDATAIQSTAANELASHLKKITGIDFPILSESQIDSDDHLLVIGPSATSAKLLVQANAPVDTDLAYDQVLVQPSGDNIILSGHPQRGMLYAVYTFLENDLDCRWWSSQCESIPTNPTPTVKLTAVNYAPKFMTRDSFFVGALGEENGIFATRIKCNGSHHSIPEEYGGHTTYQYFCHSFNMLLPFMEYYPDHPDWFPEIEGKRVVGIPDWYPYTDEYFKFVDSLEPEQVYKGTQLCLTNDEMREELTKNALKALEQNPKANFISISQNDWRGYCTCEKCRKIDEEEESQAGTMIRFVNKVAEDIEKVYPDVLVETLAYKYTLKPPKKTKARHNVVVRLCPIDCSYIQTKRSGEDNKSFAEDIKRWSEITDHLYIWDYSANFKNYYLPFPNFRINADDYRFFIENKTIGLFEEGDYGVTEGNFIHLRAWLTAKLLWDPNLDTNSLIKEFLAGYYAPEIAPLYYEYLNALADACEESGAFLAIDDHSTNHWLSLKVLNKATALQKSAMEIAQRLAKENPEKYGDLPHKTELEYLTIEMLWAMNGAAFQKQALETGAEYFGPADPKNAAEEFFTHFEKLVGNRFCEWSSPEAWEDFKDKVRKTYQ